ncbi:acyl-CoA dehydrogenase family protein [Chitinophaga sp. Hz27]|uniref:acyl-CoA dehydrogenase family protein n=1 Tax=Chitinophaga sp. Hz27 TaxID=3347169 RepID=UPI0035DEA46C
MEYSDLCTEDFLQQLGEVIKKFDYYQHPIGNLSHNEWEELVTAGIYHPLFKKRIGGRESHEEVCRIMRLAGYHHLSLGFFLMTPLTIFCRTVTNFGSLDLQERIFTDLINNNKLAGFAVIDPDAPSGATTMQTWWEQAAGGYHITGRKHWQSGSRMSEWWLIVAKDKEKGPAATTVDYFLYESTGGFQTTKTYHPLGLHLPDYGLNELDIFVPDSQRLEIPSATFTELLGLISGGWSQWASMAAGFLKRIYEEADKFVTARKTRTATLKDLGYVRFKLGMIAASKTIADIMYDYVLTQTNLFQQFPKDLFVLQAIKTTAADYMFTSANHYLELCGADGYRFNATNNFAAQALTDARGFSILGGANDVLYQLLTQYCLQDESTKGKTDFLEVMQVFPHTRDASRYLKQVGTLFQQIPEDNLAQVFYGKILSRLFIIQLLESGVESLVTESFEAAHAYCLADLNDLLQHYALSHKIAIRR